MLLISVRIAFTTAKYRHNCLFFTSFTEANGCLLYLLQTLLVMDPLSDQSVHISTLKGFKVSGNRIFFSTTLKNKSETEKLSRWNDL